jgi:hypothetical protein
MLDVEHDLARCATMLDFWERAARAFRGDGTRQAADAGGIVVPFAAYVGEIAAHARPLDDAQRATVTRLNALLTSYEFLLWFDTRAGYQDTGPYPLPDGRSMLLRQFLRLGVSDFPWSEEVASDMPYDTVLLAFVLDGVEFTVSDFGTAVTVPGDYLPHVADFAAFSVTDGKITPIDGGATAALIDAAKDAQRRQYRLIAAMERQQKIDAGAYVYFTFLRAFADAAGVADRIDWTVPKASTDLYPVLSLIDGAPSVPPLDDPGLYYTPLGNA